MKKKKFSLWFLLIGVLVASCQEQTAPAAAEPTRAEAVSEVEVVPTDTAVPQPTNSPTATPLPPPATATTIPTTAPPDVPALVWLPYASGNYGQPVLMLQNGVLSQQDLPVEAEIFFDYNGGWLAYGRNFWQAADNQNAVTDLQMYNFASKRNQQWANQVGRAAISPNSTTAGQVEVAAAVPNEQDFDLLILLGPDTSVPLVEKIDPFFSWSPDGKQIAYLRNGELFITSAARDSGNPPIASGVYQDSGWIGDAPLWLGNSGYLLLADTPFTIVATDGSETIVPMAEDGSVQVGQRPLTMLYSPITNQLVAESEGAFGSNITLYQFGDGFKTAVPIQQIEDAQLAGWFEQGKSIIIISGGDATVLPLTRQE